MSFRSFFPMLLLSFVFMVMATGCGALGSEPRTRTELVTVVVIVTATPDPNVTPQVLVVTATPDRTQIASANLGTPVQVNTALSDLQGAAQAAGSTPLPGSNVPAGCIVHTIDSGDTVFALAQEYGVNPFLMLQVNGLTEETSLGLQVGDTLVVPIEGCAIEDIPPPASSTPDAVTPTVTEAAEETESAQETPTPSVSPTLTLPPTATNAQVEIAGVLEAGDVTAEGIRIRNTGSNIRITGWIISDTDGNEYTFGDQIIFSNAELTLYTRAGQDTPVARFWGLETAIWQAGDIVTLRDTNGAVQAVFRIE